MRPGFIGCVTLLVLTGCASSSTTFGPDGRPAHVLNCSGWARTWGHSYEKAGQICGARGYEVVSRDEGGLSRSMTVACK
jgi:hypothetical protein